LNDFNDSIVRTRNSSWIFLYFFNEIRLSSTSSWFIQSLIAQPFVRPPAARSSLVRWWSRWSVSCPNAVANIRVALPLRPGSSSSACRGCGGKAWTRWP